MEIKVGEPIKDLNVLTSLELMLQANNLYHDSYDYDAFVAIMIEWGDWKHEHLAMDYIMDQLGFDLYDTILTEEDGSDCYSAERRYILRDSEKIIPGKHEVIMGQDHCYWIYDNDTDKYYETMVSWDRYKEDDFVEEFNKIGFKLYGSNWISDPEFDI